MGTNKLGGSFRYDDVDKQAFKFRSFGICRRLAINAVQDGMFGSLQVPYKLLVYSLASRYQGSVQDGHRARNILSRVLLVFNGSVVLWGCNEPDLDNWPRLARSNRKSYARWSYIWKSNRPYAHRLGPMAWFNSLLILRIGFHKKLLK